MSTKEARRRHNNMRMNADLPLSLIESNILPRLPAKSAGRCMSVCKQWRSFLSTPTFSRTHLNHLTVNNDYKLLIANHHPSVTFHTLDGSTTTGCNPNPDPSAKYILASLDGLVCLASGEIPTKLAFWNPLTGAYKKLSPCYDDFEFHMNFAYDTIGFYIDSSNDYKLLYLLFGGFNGACIYSSKLDSWRKIEFPANTSCVPMWSPGIFWDNCVYFTGINLTKSVTFSRMIIICFDVKTETFRNIPFPPILVYDDHKNYCRTLAVLNGCIHLFVSHKKSMTGTLWRMDGDDGWVKVAANNFTRQNIFMNSGIDLKENSYSIENMTWKENDQCRSRIMYIESLVSPNP